jgi:hypothetical protein
VRKAELEYAPVARDVQPVSGGEDVYKMPQARERVAGEHHPSGVAAELCSFSSTSAPTIHTIGSAISSLVVTIGTPNRPPAHHSLRIAAGGAPEIRRKSYDLMIA